MQNQLLIEYLEDESKTSKWKEEKYKLRENHVLDILIITSFVICTPTLGYQSWHSTFQISFILHFVSHFTLMTLSALNCKIWA